MSISKVVPIALIFVATGVSAPATASAQTPGVREVTASPRTLIALQTRLRYTTMIVLPEGEENRHASSMTHSLNVAASAGS